MSKKIDQFTELAAQPATTDLFLLELASNGQYRKIKWQNVVADGSITTNKLAGSAVTAPKVNFGGAGSGIWWEEIARTTLGIAGDTITVSSIPARTYLRILWSVIPSGAIDITGRFNNDTGANYGYRYGVNLGASTGSAVSQTSLTLDLAGTASVEIGYMDVLNITAQEKVAIGRAGDNAVAGAANLPEVLDFVGKWANTSAQISRFDLLNGGAGDMAIGSEVIILGHN